MCTKLSGVAAQYTKYVEINALVKHAQEFNLIEVKMLTENQLFGKTCPGIQFD